MPLSAPSMTVLSMVSSQLWPSTSSSWSVHSVALLILSIESLHFQVSFGPMVLKGCVPDCHSILSVTCGVYLGMLSQH